MDSDDLDLKEYYEEVERLQVQYSNKIDDQINVLKTAGYHVIDYRIQALLRLRAIILKENDE